MANTGRLSGKVALITGAASGIGAAMARRFHQEGAKIVAFDISGAEVDLVDSLGNDCVAVHGDASNSADIQSALQVTTEKFGQLDILVNNAGIEGSMTLLTDTSEADFDRVFAVNVRGVFLGMKYGIPVMLESGGGVVLNMASSAGLFAAPALGGYGASKSACIMLSLIAAKAYAKEGIRSNVICPGTIDTPMLRSAPPEILKNIADQCPIGRLGDADEIAATALFLVSDEASYVTGAVVSVDGGLTA